MPTCPECKSNIPLGAMRCPKCTSWLDEPAGYERSSPQEPIGAVLSFFIGSLVSIFVSIATLIVGYLLLYALYLYGGYNTRNVYFTENDYWVLFSATPVALIFFGLLRKMRIVNLQEWEGTVWGLTITFLSAPIVGLLLVIA